jgi:alpha-N-arabinofuranosidase
MFCRHLGTEPLVVVNTGFGDPHSAAEEVEYANGSADTPMGRKRAEHGHAKPRAVKWWGIGNEMYGGWQLGHMKLDHYVLKHNETVERMREVDPDIITVGVGDAGPWTEGMLRRCSNHMDLISEHFYCGEKPSVYEHVRQIPDAIRRKADAHREYRKTIGELDGKNIRIAMDEWNYWYGPHVYGELGTRYFLQDALGIAAGIHEFARQSDIVFMANYAQTVNVIGCIKTTKTDAAFATTGLVLKLYREHFGEIPVQVETSYPLDAAAAWTADGKALTVAVVNPSADTLSVPVLVAGATLTGKGNAWTITGPDPKAYNEPGKPQRVRIEETTVDDFGEKIEVPPCAVRLYRLETGS